MYMSMYTWMPVARRDVRALSASFPLAAAGVWRCASQVVAWDATATLGVRPAGSLGAMCCGGEGCFNTTLTGPGEVYVQTMSFERFKQALKTVVKKQKNKKNNAGGGPPNAQDMQR